MHKIYNSENRKFRLYIRLKCKGKKSFRLWAEDYGKKNSKYADRVVNVENERTVFFSFPVSPKNLFIGCLNANDVKDKEYEITLIEAPLESFDIKLDDEAKKFLELCIPFCQICGFTNAPSTGKLYEHDAFRIKYFDVIKDVLSGKRLTTPARIGHSTGTIEVAKYRFDSFTIPMRLVILLHEFSHKYRNPKMNLPISNEFGADINALYIYLGLGFSKIDAICVFANVFLKAQTQQNIERMRKIMDYISKFEKQEFAKKI